MTLLLLAVGAFAVALSAGSVSVDWADVLQGLNGRDLSVDYTVVFQLRLPRAVTAFVVGGMLGLAGVLMQILKLAGVQPVDAKMIGAEQPAEMPADETELANSPAGYTNDQKVQSIDDLVNVHSGGLNKQKVQIKKGHPGDNELTAEDLANSLRTQYESFKEQYAKAVTEAKKKD